jgi:hypothetical protein
MHSYVRQGWWIIKTRVKVSVLPLSVWPQASVFPLWASPLELGCCTAGGRTEGQCKDNGRVGRCPEWEMILLPASLGSGVTYLPLRYFEGKNSAL